MSEQEEILNEVSDVVENTATVIKNNPYILAAVGIVGLAVGTFAGYKFANKKMEADLQELLEEEIQKTKEYYTTLAKRGDYETPEKAAEKLIPAEERAAREALTTYKSGKIEYNRIEEDDVNGDEVEETVEVKTEEEIEQPVTHHNIFVDGKPLGPDEEYYEHEDTGLRTTEYPYVITEEEYFANEQEFTQITCTYYEGDDVLVDEQDKPIDDVEEMVGEANLKRFGTGSKDRNIVYIKNNKRGLDFEIARSRGKYTVEVLGFDDEERQPLRRFRGGDD